MGRRAESLEEERGGHPQPPRFRPRQQTETFDHVAEFTDISGPAIFTQFPDGFFGEDFFFPAVLRRHLAREMADQLGKILQALA